MYRCEDPQTNTFSTCSPIAVHQCAANWPHLKCERVGWNGELIVQFSHVKHAQHLQPGYYYALGIDGDGQLVRVYMADNYIPECHRYSARRDPVPPERWAEIYGRQPCIYSAGGFPELAGDTYYSNLPDIEDREYFEELEPRTYTPSNGTPRSQASISDVDDDPAASRYARKWYSQGGGGDYEETGSETDAQE